MIGFKVLGERMQDYTEAKRILNIHKDDIDNVVFTTNVAGTTFVENSCEILRFLKEKVSKNNILLNLVREPENPYDENAVRVEISVKGAKKFVKIGYVPKDKAELLSYVLQDSSGYHVRVQDISLFGGEGSKPNIGIFFDYFICKDRA